LGGAGGGPAVGGRAGIAGGGGVLDRGCGEGGPGLHLARELGCTYVGADADSGAVARARQRAADAGLEARVDHGRVPPVPAGPFDVVLLLETMLAFADRRALLAEIASVLVPGGRFVFTLEEGVPLTRAEAAAMPERAQRFIDAGCGHWSRVYGGGMRDGPRGGRALLHCGLRSKAGVSHAEHQAAAPPPAERPPSTGRKPSPADLVIQVPFVLGHAHGGELFREVGVGTAFTLQLRF